MTTSAAERSFLLQRVQPALSGLMDGSLRPRQSFQSLRNLMSLFGGERASPAGSPLVYRLAGGSPALKQHAFRTAEGGLLLILYRDVDSFDLWTRRELQVSPERVQLTLETPAETVEMFDPGSSGNPFRTIRRANALTVPVTDAVVAVKVSGGLPTAV